MTMLIDAAKAVVARWDSPLWKDLPATAGYIAALRQAIEQAEQTGHLDFRVPDEYAIKQCLDVRAELEELSSYFRSISWISHSSRISDLASHLGIYAHQIEALKDIKAENEATH